MFLTGFVATKVIISGQPETSYNGSKQKIKNTLRSF
jgi:hypothetical protein